MNDQEIKNLDESFAKLIDENCHAKNFEGNHEIADAALCDLLKALGCDKTVEAFERVEKFCA